MLSITRVMMVNICYLLFQVFESPCIGGLHPGSAIGNISGKKMFHEQLHRQEFRTGAATMPVRELIYRSFGLPLLVRDAVIP